MIEMRRLLATVLSICFLTVSQSYPATAAIYALVIGIDDYDHIPDLDGAVNDANDISDALEGIGAEVTLLLNRDATRNSIVETWTRLAEKVGPGDLLIVSYAGHGSNEPEFWEGNELDSRDETILFSEFEPFGLGSVHRLRDDDIAELVAMTPPAQTVFLADSCHAGTVSRSVNPVLGYRYYSYGKVVDDALPPPPPNTSPDEGRGEIGLFLAAVDESAKVPEFLIDGKPRGALSYAFANALRGAADADTNSEITLGEIETYVRRSIRQISHGLQAPEIRRGGGVDEVLISLIRENGAETSVGQITAQGPDGRDGVWDMSFGELPELGLYIDSEAVPSVEGARIVSDRSEADLVLDAATGRLTSMIGDVVAEVSTNDIRDLQNALDKIRMATAMVSEVAVGPMEIIFAEGDKTYHAGEIVDVTVSGRSTQYLTLFNISANGIINYLYPVTDSDTGIDDPLEIAPKENFSLPLQITNPFGAEHIVAVQTDVAPEDLRDAIIAYDGTSDVRGLWRQLQTFSKEQTGEVSWAIFPFHSAK